MKEKKMQKNKIITNQTCGKLYIALEYSILTAGQSAIIKNINLFMTSKINFADKYTIFSDMFDYAITLEQTAFDKKTSQNFDKNYSLICETITVINEYLKYSKS